MIWLTNKAWQTVLLTLVLLVCRNDDEGGGRVKVDAAHKNNNLWYTPEVRFVHVTAFIDNGYFHGVSGLLQRANWRFFSCHFYYISFYFFFNQVFKIFGWKASTYRFLACARTSFYASVFCHPRAVHRWPGIRRNSYPRVQRNSQKSHNVSYVPGSHQSTLRLLAGQSTRPRPATC